MGPWLSLLNVYATVIFSYVQFIKKSWQLEGLNLYYIHTYV